MSTANKNEDVGEQMDEQMDEETESIYDDDVDVDVDDVQDADDRKPAKGEEEDDEEDDDDGEEDDGSERPVSKSRQHIYHQIPDSSEIKIVAPEKRITSECMTIYEYSMVVGTRATHIAEGSILYTDPQGLFDPRDIAKKEINENKCPLSITRKVSPTAIEVWEVNEMIKPLL